MSKRHYRVTEADVLGAHATALELGGVDGIVRRDNILSAVGRPYTGYYPRIYQKAAALLESLAGNHGFVDGNKRTALIVVTTFVSRSGYGIEELEDDLGEELEELILGVASGRLRYDECLDWFKRRLVRIL